jgi:hypothetical protein
MRLRQLLRNCCSVCSHFSQTSAGRRQPVITLDTDHCLRHNLTNTAFWKTAVLPAQRQYLFKLLMAPVGNYPNLQNRIKTTKGAYVWVRKSKYQRTANPRQHRAYWIHFNKKYVIWQQCKESRAVTYVLRIIRPSSYYVKQKCTCIRGNAYNDLTWTAPHR